MKGDKMSKFSAAAAAAAASAAIVLSVSVMAATAANAATNDTSRVTAISTPPWDAPMDGVDDCQHLKHEVTDIEIKNTSLRIALADAKENDQTFRAWVITQHIQYNDNLINDDIYAESLIPGCDSGQLG